MLSLQKITHFCYNAYKNVGMLLIYNTGLQREHLIRLCLHSAKVEIYLLLVLIKKKPKQTRKKEFSSLMISQFLGESKTTGTCKTELLLFHRWNTAVKPVSLFNPEGQQQFYQTFAYWNDIKALGALTSPLYQEQRIFSTVITA